MFYNKKYVDTPPSNYEELKALSEKLDSANTNVWAMGMPLAGETQWTLMSLLAQYDYDYMGDGYVDFNSPEAADILMNVHKWIHEDGISPANLGVDDHCNLFITTADANTMQMALSLTGPWDYSNFAAVLGDDLGIAPVPVFGAHQAVNGSGHNFAVSAACEDQAVLDGIAEFMKYVYQPDAAELGGRRTGSQLQGAHGGGEGANGQVCHGCQHLQHYQRYQGASRFLQREKPGD